MAADGLTTIPSGLGPKETADRLEAEIEARGMTVFARIDHAAGAASVGLPLQPTELLIFGSAKAGTPLMQADQAIGIDLPLKALVHEDPAGKVWLSYNESDLARTTARARRSRRSDRRGNGGSARCRCQTGYEIFVTPHDPARRKARRQDSWLQLQESRSWSLCAWSSRDPDRVSMTAVYQPVADFFFRRAARWNGR
jgi:uncharacterized protein (DUF302 family)